MLRVHSHLQIKLLVAEPTLLICSCQLEELLQSVLELGLERPKSLKDHAMAKESRNNRMVANLPVV